MNLIGLDLETRLEQNKSCRCEYSTLANLRVPKLAVWSGNLCFSLFPFLFLEHKTVAQDRMSLFLPFFFLCFFGGGDFF
jgi:hypothetical protein